MSSKTSKRVSWHILIFCLLLTACSGSPGASPTPAARACGDFIIDNRLLCLSAGPSAILLQSPDDTQITIDLDGANITIEGTLFIDRGENHLTIATIEGTGVVGVSGATRVIQPGAQVDLGPDDAETVRILTSPYPFDVSAIREAPFDQLTRAVSMPSPIAPPPDYTPPPTLTPTVTLTIPPVNGNTVTPLPTATATPCMPPTDWTGVYTVQRGDTLSRIAQRFDMEMTDLQSGNCIDNPDRIRVGQVLQMPLEVFLATESPPTPVPTSEGVDFRAEQETIESGRCTTVYWKVENATAVYFEDEVTTAENVRQVCPAITTSYTLVVVYPGGQQRSYAVTVMVASN